MIRGSDLGQDDSSILGRYAAFYLVYASAVNYQEHGIPPSDRQIIMSEV